MRGVSYDILFYKQLESDQIKSVQQNKGYFEANITLSNLFIKELTWWENNTKLSTTSLRTVPVNPAICTDPILDGWGAVFEIGDMWTKQEQELHMTVLELLGPKPGLLTFIKYIRTIMDNNIYWKIRSIHNDIAFDNGNGLQKQNNKYGFQQHTSQDRKT